MSFQDEMAAKMKQQKAKLEKKALENGTKPVQQVPKSAAMEDQAAPEGLKGDMMKSMAERRKAVADSSDSDDSEDWK